MRKLNKCYILVNDNYFKNCIISFSALFRQIGERMHAANNIICVAISLQTSSNSPIISFFRSLRNSHDIIAATMTASSCVCESACRMRSGTLSVIKTLLSALRSKKRGLTVESGGEERDGGRETKRERRREIVKKGSTADGGDG